MKFLHVLMLIISLSTLLGFDSDFSNFTEFGETTGTDVGYKFYPVNEGYLINGTPKGFSIFHTELGGALVLIDTIHTKMFQSFTNNDTYLALSNWLMPNIEVYNIEDMDNIYYSHTIETNYNVSGIKILSNNRLIVNKLNDHSLLLDITNGNELIIYSQYLFRVDSFFDEEVMLANDTSTWILKWVSIDQQNQIIPIKTDNRSINYGTSAFNHLFLAVDNHIKMYDTIYDEVALDSILVNWYDDSFASRGIEIIDSKLLFIDVDFNYNSQMDEPVLKIYDIVDNQFLFFDQEFFLENWDNRDYFLSQKVISCNTNIYVNAEEEGIKGYQILDNQLELISQYGDIAYWESSFLNRDNKLYLNARKKDRECIIFDLSNFDNPTTEENDFPYGQYSTFPYQSDYIYKKSYVNNEIEFFYLQSNYSLDLLGTIPMEYYYLYYNFIPLMMNSDYIVYQLFNDIYVGFFNNGVFQENYSFNLGSSNSQREFTAFMRNGYLYCLASNSNQNQIYDIDENNYELVLSDNSHNYFINNPVFPVRQISEKYFYITGSGGYNYIIDLSTDNISILGIYRLDYKDRAMSNIENYFFMNHASSSILEIKEFDSINEPHFTLTDTITFSSNVQSVDLIQVDENNYNMVVTTMGSIFYYQCAITPNGDLEITPVTLNAINYPNPFNPETTISYDISKQGNVSVDIYNLKGQKVKSLLNETQEAGQHKIIWKSDNNEGKRVSSGSYFYRVKSGDKDIVNKMMLMK